MSAPGDSGEINIRGFRGMSLSYPGDDPSRPLLIANGYAEGGVLHRRLPAWRPAGLSYPASPASYCLGLFPFRSRATQRYVVSVHGRDSDDYVVRLIRGRHALVNAATLRTGEPGAYNLDAWFTSAVMNGALYLSNGQIPIHRITDFENGDGAGGMTIEELTAIDREERKHRTGGDDYGAYRSVPPRGRYLLHHGFRLFVAGDPADPYALGWCNLGDPRGWPYSNLMHIGDNDGAPPTGLASIGTDINGGVLVFTDHSIWLCRGDFNTAERTTRERIVNGVGTPSHRCIAQGDGVAYFLGSDGQPYSISMGGLVPMGEETGAARIFTAHARGSASGHADYSPYVANPEALSRSIALYYPSRRWFIVHYATTGTTPNAVFAMDVRSGDWFIHTATPATLAVIPVPNTEAAAAAIVQGVGTESTWLRCDTGGSIYMEEAVASESETEDGPAVTAYLSRFVLGPILSRDMKRAQIKEIYASAANTVDGLATVSIVGDGRSTTTSGMALNRNEPNRRRSLGTFSPAPGGGTAFAQGVDALAPAMITKRRIRANDPIQQDVAVDIRSALPVQLAGIRVPATILSEN